MYGATTANPTANPLISLLPMVVVLGFFYLFVIRPQQKRDKEVQAMRAALKLETALSPLQEQWVRFYKLRMTLLLLKSELSKIKLRF